MAYYMYNHDCNAMGAGEEHPGWVFRLPKVRFGFPHSRRRISRAFLLMDGMMEDGMQGRCLTSSFCSIS